MAPFVPRIVPGTNGVCPRDKPGEIGLPLCKMGRKPGLVPGFHRICPRDKPGEIPGTNPGSSLDQPDKKVYIYVPFSCLINFLAPEAPHFVLPEKVDASHFLGKNAKSDPRQLFRGDFWGQKGVPTSQFRPTRSLVYWFLLAFPRGPGYPGKILGTSRGQSLFPWDRREGMNF